MNKLRSIRDQTFSLLEEKLDHQLEFHCLDHTVWVYEEAKRIGSYLSLTDTQLELLEIAAICHDVGYLEKHDGNESLGASYAEKLMKLNDYNPEQIEIVRQLILETNLNKQPTTLLSRCLRDADSGYIGTSIFKSWSQRLYREYRNFTKVEDQHAWNKLQLSFFEEHQFYTGFSNLYRLPGKLKNKEELMQMLEC